MRVILIVLVCIGLRGIGEAQQAGRTASNLSLSSLMQSVQNTMLRQTINTVIKRGDGSSFNDSLSITDVIADAQHCSLTWANTQNLDGATFKEVNQLSLSSVAGFSAIPSGDLKLTFDPSLMVVRGFMEPGATVAMTTTGYRGDGSILQQSKTSQAHGFSIAMHDINEANNLVTALQSAQSACRATVPTAASGPTLGESIAFISETLAEQGDFHFVTHRSGERTGDVNWSYGNQRVSLVGYCEAQFTFLQNSKDNKQGVSLGNFDPRDVRVQDFGGFHEYLNAKDSKAPKVTFVAEPPVYLVNIKRVTKENTVDYMSGFFLDKSTAERVAKAYIHSIVLCGGGKDQPF